MSIEAQSNQLEVALSNLPSDFRDRVFLGYKDVRTALSDGNFDAATLRVGKLAEIILRLLQQHLTGSYTPFGTHITNFAAECLRLESSPASAGSEHLRVVMPRALSYVYTLRNKRGVGHAGGDVESNEIDAVTAARIADWCVCELVREFHSLSLEEAQAILDAISVRQFPDVWAVAGKKRIMASGLDYKSQVLLLLHSESPGTVLLEDLYDWVEYWRLSDFRSKVIRPLHKDRFVEYDSESELVTISPKGVERVEDQILPKLRRAG